MVEAKLAVNQLAGKFVYLFILLKEEQNPAMHATTVEICTQAC
jgi:hypothetical protein